MKKALYILLGLVVLVVVAVIADLTIALLIAGGTVKGDFWLPLVFAVIPAVAAVYVLTLLTRQPDSNPTAGN